MNGFDPFGSRKCRDIRNRLSQGFLTTLETHSLSPLQQAVTDIDTQDPAPVQREYVTGRVRAYTHILVQPASALNHVFTTARLLWNAALFFECHEWLEPAWMAAEGGEKKALQGLIRAAAFYVLLEGGRVGGASKTAQKAVGLIQAHKAFIPQGLHTDLILARLETRDPRPPHLASFEFSHGKALKS